MQTPHTACNLHGALPFGAHVQQTIDATSAQILTVYMCNERVSMVSPQLGPNADPLKRLRPLHMSNRYQRM